MAARRLVIVGTTLAVTASLTAALPGSATGRPAADRLTGATLGPLSPTLSVTDRLDDRRFVAAGERSYEVATEAGRYPAMGFHTRGEMGGIWTPPLKLLDGLWFGVDGSWVGPATRFTSGYGYTRMQLPGPAGVRLTRTDFAPDGHRAVLVGLTMSTGATAQRVRLTVDAHSELMSAYPWGETTPSQLTYNLPDTASFDGRHLVFREVGTPPVANATRHDWAAIVGSSLRPLAARTGTAFRGPQDPPVICPTSGPNTPAPPTRCDDTAYGKGAGGQLRYAIDLPARTNRTVWFTVAGSDKGLAAAYAQWHAAARHPAAELARKVTHRLDLAARSRVSLPGDPGLAKAVDWAKQNLADLTQQASDLAIRRTHTGTVYPAPAGHVRHIRFEGAGFPDYPWLFATDGEYTTFAAGARSVQDRRGTPAGAARRLGHPQPPLRPRRARGGERRLGLLRP
jgi:hypothetical protein